MPKTRDFSRVLWHGGHATRYTGVAFIDIDETELGEVLDRAIRNKGKRAKSGPLVVTVRNVQKSEEK